MSSRGQPNPAHAADERRQLCLSRAAPWGNPSLWRLVPQAPEASPHSAVILGLQKLFPHPLARVALLLRAQMLPHPPRHPLLVMQRAPHVLRPLRQVGLGLSPIRAADLGPLLEAAPWRAQPAPGPVAPRGP